MDKIGPIEVAWEQALLSDHVNVEVENGAFIETLPQLFARRSGFLSRELDEQADPFTADGPVRMHEVDQATFKIYKLWSAEKRPRLREAYRRSIDISLAVTLARMAEKYSIPALANEICDIFRENLVEGPLRDGKRRPWYLEPDWVMEIYRALPPAAGLIRLIEDALCILRGRRHPLTSSEMDAWEPVIREHPDFAVAFLRRGDTAESLELVDSQNLCYYHDHSAEHSVRYAFADDEDACPRVGDWYPSWMRQRLKVNPFAVPLALQPEDLPVAAVTTTISDLGLDLSEDDDIQFVEPEKPVAKSLPRKKGKK